MRHDLKLHILGGFIAAVYVAPWSVPLAALAGVIAATGREAWNTWGPQSARTGWAWDDIRYTLYGTSLGMVVGYTCARIL